MMNEASLFKISSLCVICLVLVSSLHAKTNPTLSCRIPFAPHVKSVPIYNTRTQRFEGNCRVYGDKGAAICHAPNEKPKSLQRLFNITKHDSLFYDSQHITGISWKLIKSFVYQETSFIQRYIDISKITSSDGLGVGYMQLTKKSVKRELRYMKKYFKTYIEGRAKDISSDSVFHNELHHIVLGTSWLMHKFNIRTKWSHLKMSNFVEDIAFKYRSTDEGWGIRESKKDMFIYAKLKEAITAYNGLSSGCVVQGRVLTAYGDVVEYYYNSLLKKSEQPLPYQSYTKEKYMEVRIDSDVSTNIEADSIHNNSLMAQQYSNSGSSMYSISNISNIGL